MISKKLIKAFVGKNYGKKLGAGAIRKLDKQLEEKINEILKRAVRRADFSGRTVIKEEDIVEV